MDISPACSDISIDLDSTVLHQVQRAIHRFAAATQQESDIDDETPLPTLSPTKDTAERTFEDKKCDYESQIKSLELEIHLLEDELKRRDHHGDVTDDQLEQAMLSITRSGQAEGAHTSSPSNSPSNSSDSDQLQALRSQIRLSEAFSGVKLKDVSWEITQKDDHGLFRKHIHSGSSHGFSFQVQFVAREDKIPCGEEGSVDRAKIVALRAQVDPDLRTEMQVYLKRASTDRDLMNFYQTFVKCCQHVVERRTTFSKLKSSYSDRIQLSSGVNGTRMRFLFDNGCCLNLNWNVTVTDQGQVDHSITLQTKSSANVSEDQRDGLSQLPQLLQKITLIKGHSQGLIKFLSLLIDPTSHSTT